MSRAGKLAPEVNRALFVKNLSYTVTPEDLFELFGKFGPIRQVRQGIATNTKGTAFVVYEDVMDAKQACDKLNGFNFQGRYLVAREDGQVKRGPRGPQGEFSSAEAEARHRLTIRRACGRSPDWHSTSTSSIVKPVSKPTAYKKKQEVKPAPAVVTQVTSTRKSKPDHAAEQARRSVLGFVRGFLPHKTSNKMVMT
ncbi:hypothetical protein TruAng_007891 [Truncatella angustata]|nr:hypothetical protein TruAng_007891 [Truncatella angustata]